ncbi:MAG: putative transporter [Deltaproteobacteria bacterium]|nr:putative transporter [Deltaproteobacteria bacterium]
MQFFIDILKHNHLLLIFVVAGLGYALGHIKVKGFSLGISAVLFVGLFFGALDKDIRLPEIVQMLGLVIFVYAVGVSSGPGFFASLKGRGLAENLLAVGTLLFGALIIVLIKKVFHISSGVAAGLFCGSFTNTPALAAVIEAIKRSSLDDEVSQLASEPVFGYSIAYPMGVIGILLSFYFLQRIFKIDFVEEAMKFPEQVGGQRKIVNLTIRVTRGDIKGIKISDLIAHRQLRVIFGRYKRGNKLELVESDTVLDLGDLVTVVGEEADVMKAVELIGEVSNISIDMDRTVLDFRRILVSNKEVVERPIRDLKIPKRFRALITRVRRGDIEFVPNGDTVLELGDRVRVLGPRERMDEISRYFGDSFKAISEIDIVPFALGIALGILLGSIPIPVTHEIKITLGIAGGPLIVGLILGRLGKTGHIIWQIPYNANLTLRQLGIILFMAGVGTRSGFTFYNTLKEGNGPLIFFLGSFVTISAVSLAIIIGYKLLKIPFSIMTGVVSGIHTQPSALAFANQQSGLDSPNLGYATVYPVSTILKIVLAQVIILL